MRKQGQQIPFALADRLPKARPLETGQTEDTFFQQMRQGGSGLQAGTSAYQEMDCQPSTSAGPSKPLPKTDDMIREEYLQQKEAEKAEAAKKKKPRLQQRQKPPSSKKHKKRLLKRKRKRKSKF